MSSDKSVAVNKESADLITVLAPYVASFGFLAHDQTPPRLCCCSCFFLIINDHWVMCTAGHVMDQIRSLKSNGIKLTGWHVNDVFTKSEREFALPFDITAGEQLTIRDDELGLDYCLVYVDEFFVRGMASGGLRAIDRGGIGDPSKADRWIVTGFPSQFTKSVDKGVRQRHYVIGVTPIDRPDDWEPGKNRESLFGQLEAPAGEGFEGIDIGGMSGGPIFGLFKQGDGKLSVKLVAVQSGWSDRTRRITACPVEPFLEAIDRLIADPSIGAQS